MTTRTWVLYYQVTEGKSGLEQALKLTKKLKKESGSLREFVTSTDKELGRRESMKNIKDLEEEITWIKVDSLLLFLI